VSARDWVTAAYDKDIAELEAAPRQSPAQPTMQPGEHLGPQFAGIEHAQPAGRHPWRVGNQALADWRTSPSSAGTKETT
jgi:hypothetical protein